MTGSTLNSVKSSVMSNDTVSPLDENTRRYYLDVMGVQCWQSLDCDVESTQQTTNDNAQQCITGRGNKKADLLFVLLAPTVSDEANGMLCSGDEDELLSKMLSAINISIENVYITPLLKHAVPTNHPVSPEDIASGNEYLQQQIQLIKPKLVVVLGESAIRFILQKDMPLDDFRALNAEQKNQVGRVPVFVSYSPDELLQKPENKRNAWSDLQLLQKMTATF